MGLDAFRNEIEELKRLASDPNVNEETLRSLARALNKKLKPIGYIVFVRKAPEWSSGPRFWVIVSRLGSRGRGSKGVVRDVELIFYEGPEEG